jgi:putative phosphoribosyl transferase
MLDFTPDGAGVPLSVRSERGLLYGELALLPASPGLVVLARAAAEEDGGRQLAGQFRRAGLSTFAVELVAQQEERFPDVHNHVPLLARRLTDFLGLLRNRMLMGELREQPVGLFAVDAAAPAAVRAAALRDHDIAAIVCRGGLVDLAGMLYLRSLQSPLLLLVEKDDERRIAGNRRALEKISCRKELKIIPAIGSDDALSAGGAVCLYEAVEWFNASFAERGKYSNLP